MIKASLETTDRRIIALDKLGRVDLKHKVVIQVYNTTRDRIYWKKAIDCTIWCSYG